MGFGMQSVVFAWLVTIVLREPADLVGWAQTAMLLPGMVFILIAGAVADRVGPDRQAFAAQMFAALTPWILIGAAYLGVLSFPIMIVYAILMGVAQAFVTPARDGLLNHVAGSKVQRTVLVSSLFQFGMQIIGYSLASYADDWGAAPILAIQSAAMVFGALAFGMIRRSGVVVRSTEEHPSVLQGVLEGARTVAASPIMRVVVIQNVAMALFFMGCFIVCFPLVVREVFDGSSGDLSVLNAFNSLGLVLTILLMQRIGYVKRPGLALLLYQGLGAAVLLSSGLVDHFGLFVFAIFCWGLCGGVAMPMSRTLMQELAPVAQRSRVMSFYALSFMGAGPLGTLLCGYLSKLFGPQMAIVICGSAMLIVVLVITVTTSIGKAEFSQAQEQTV